MPKSPNISTILQNESGEKPVISNHICSTCRTSSQDQPIHCITTASSPIPQSYASNPTAPAARTSPPSNLSLPTLDTTTASRLSKPLPPQPALRFDSAERSRVRFRRTILSPLSPHGTDEDFNANSHRNSHSGLGIAQAPFHPDLSPIQSPTIETITKSEIGDEGQRSKRPTNIAERIEEKLWKYSGSGNVLKRWLIEITSWVLSAICMGTIIGVLIFLDDRPEPHWGLGITVNDFVSVVSRVASAALLIPVSEALGQLKWLWFRGESRKMWDFEIFDNASRGPWGSLMLLVRTKGNSLAALGAAVTLFAIALDPFFQKLVDYPSKTTLDSTMNSTIPKVLQYRPHYDYESRSGYETALVDQDMQTVLLNYLYGNGTKELPAIADTRLAIPLSCPTSNCTWPEYDSLAICSACEDISELLTYRRESGALDWIANTSLADPEKIANGTMYGWFLNATESDMRSKPILMSGYRESTPQFPNKEALITRVLPLVTNPMRERLYGDGSYHFKSIQNPLLDFFVVSAANGVESVYRHERPVAHECMLSWCVQTMKSSYFEAVYREQVTNITMNTTATDSPWTAKSVTTPFGNGTDIRFLPDIYIERNGNVFGASNLAAARTTFAYDDYFPSTYTQGNDSDIAWLRYKAARTNNIPFLRNISYNPFLAPNNVTNHMEKLAKALTNMMRSTNENEWVYGDVFSEVIFVHVRWAWLTLPLVLLVFTFFFLAGTVIKSYLAKEDVGAWKTSAIATLIYGLPDDMQKAIVAQAPDDFPRTPRAQARKMKVNMLPKTGWKMCDNQPTPHSTTAQQSRSPSTLV